MKKYDSYKNSGIEWIGEIPIHWNVARLKFNSRIKTGYTPPMDNSENYSEDGMIWVKPDNLEYFKEILDSKEKVSVQGVKEQNIITKGSVLLCCIGTIGKFGIAGLDLLTNQQICGVTFIESLIPSFGKYLIYSSEEELNKHANGNVVRILNATSLGNIVYPIPTIEEQTTISNYLDQKTTQIDDLIAKKERLIQLLEEERTAIINQAVTKGLDPTVPMKDSGIEWLGEIPAHWEEARIKNVVNIIGRIGFRGYTTQDLVQKGEGAISLSPSNIKNHILNIDDCTYLSWEKYHESPEIKIFENDIILVKTGSTIGKTSIIPSGTPEMTLNPQLVVFKDIKLNPVFLYYIMISNYFQGYFSIYTAGGSTPAISQEKINNFKITFPSELEQVEISNFISHKESEIKRIISKTQQEIELLKEYKTALISEVVTGKVDVRNVVLN